MDPTQPLSCAIYTTLYYVYKIATLHPCKFENHLAVSCVCSAHTVTLLSLPPKLSLDCADFWPHGLLNSCAAGTAIIAMTLHNAMTSFYCTLALAVSSDEPALKFIELSSANVAESSVCLAIGAFVAVQVIKMQNRFG
jgi:hypothetical protein